MLTPKPVPANSTPYNGRLPYRVLPPTRYRSARRPRTYVARGVMFAFAGFLCAAFLRVHGSEANRWLMVLPFILCMAATRDAVRSMHVSWDLHHGGVLFLLYADMMLLTLIAVWTIWPL
ncbi:hypothetical protein [Terriglobus roseus]|uniref:Uncharacterized protein n=1 Tax=Terriglobus roseus TaxID=392734 RepID=A0A1H4J762_9BACT|nr:hypothetical protein [Terriglobus roseus]SEB42130.1 hypothetical protein SAMN05443244_0416 [Terriglobus roseus]